MLAPSADAHSRLLETAIKAVLDDGGASTDIGAVLRRHWRQAKATLFSRHFSNGSFSPFNGEGGAISRGLSETMDVIIRTLAPLVCDERIAVLATGGYGRGRLAPFSDVDLLVLADGDDHEARLAPFLYALWDGGLPLSHSAHTPASAVAAATDDTVTRTAFLDARFLVGDEALFHRFQGRFDRLRRRTLADFVEAKLRERDDRHDKMGASRYAIEPDIKEGKGGLRDLDTLHWLNRYVSGFDVDATAEVDSLGLFTAGEERRLKRITEFLWSVRVHLHDVAGRAEEKLQFTVQPHIAERLGFADKGGKTGVERFMRYYFLNAKEVGKLTGSACALLEERALKETRLGRRVAGVVGRFVQETGFDGCDNLLRRGGRVTFVDHDAALERSDDVFSLFLASGRHQLPIHPDAFKTASRVARRLMPAEREQGGLAVLFRQILRESPRLETVLRNMTECGLLGRYLPTYGSVVGKVEYGLFRQYTLDEHILRSIGVLSDMLNDRDDGRFKITKPLAKEFGDPAPLYLALLLQETKGAVKGDDNDDPVARARETARLVLDDEPQADLVAFAIEYRDLLFRTASRRNVTDRQLVAGLATQIESHKRLACIAILTSCRHRTAGLRSWEEYAKRDVRLLVQSIGAQLDGGQDALDSFLEDRRQGLRRQARGLLSPDDVPQFDRFIEGTGPTFWSMTDVTSAADFSLLLGQVDAAGARGGAMVEVEPGGMLTILVCGDDKPNLFAACAGVVAEIGGTVWDASAFPVKGRPGEPNHACLIFKANRAGPPPGPFHVSTEEQEAIRRRFEEIAREQGSPPRVPAPNIGDRRAVFDVASQVREDGTLSAEALIVEVEALDRPGLLFYLASALAQIDVSIQLAFVATYGHRAVDTFYLQEANGDKISDPKRIEDIRHQLLSTLEAI